MPVLNKKPHVTGFTKWKFPPSKKSLIDWATQYPNANIGLITGELSDITVVDIDDPNLIEGMLDRYGKTPLQVRTPSDGVHLYYRHSGEGCQNLRTEGLAVDIKGQGGFVVAPPSIGDNGAYAFMEGDWLCIPNLPPMLKTDAPVTNKSGNNDNLTPYGTRNNSLFNHLCGQYHYCDYPSIDLFEIANTFRLSCDDYPPMADTEFINTVNSVLKYAADGRLFVKGQGGTIVRHTELDLLAAHNRCGDALMLLHVLRRNQSHHGEPFSIAVDSMARDGVIPGWKKSPGRYEKARSVLLDLNLIRKIHQGTGRGNSSKFELVKWQQ
jgi:hypothetical protein